MGLYDVDLLPTTYRSRSRPGSASSVTHDLRRTFISLALADGARKDVLRWVTHGPEGDIVDLYTTLPWSALCEAVAALKVTRRDGAVIELPVTKSTEQDRVEPGPPGFLHGR
jgi:hypothetical protein